jgi:hypothetical protein
MKIPLPTMNFFTITNMDSNNVVPAYQFQIGEQSVTAGRGGKVKLINMDMAEIEAYL